MKRGAGQEHHDATENDNVKNTTYSLYLSQVHTPFCAKQTQFSLAGREAGSRRGENVRNEANFGEVSSVRFEV